MQYPTIENFHTMDKIIFRAVGKLRSMKTRKVRPWYEVARAAFKDKGMVYEEIAEKLGASTSAVGHWLTGKREPPLETIQKMAAILGKTVSELCGEDAYFVVDREERQIIDSVRNMTPQERALLLRMLPRPEDTNNKK